MQITTKGQVTIPQHIREQLGLLPHTEVEFEIVGDHARIRKARRPAGSRCDAPSGAKDCFPVSQFHNWSWCPPAERADGRVPD